MTCKSKVSKIGAASARFMNQIDKIANVSFTHDVATSM